MPMKATRFPSLEQVATRPPLVCMTTFPRSSSRGGPAPTGGGTATPGGSGDYLASSGRLSISPNTTNQFFFVNLVDNAVFEPAETVHLTLSGVTGASSGPRMEADVAILDDDGPPQFVAPRLTTNGDFRVTFIGAPGQTFRLHVSTNLPNWSVSTTLTNNASGLMEYTVPVSPGPPQRFYKTSVP